MKKLIPILLSALMFTGCAGTSNNQTNTYRQITMDEAVKQVFARQDEFVADPHTFRELEIVRQTLIAVEKMKKNGDCIAEGELGVRSPFPYAEDGDENH